MSTPNPARIIGAGVAIMGMLVGPASGVVYGISEWKLRRPNDAPLVPLRATAAPNLAEGERMARIVGFQASFGAYWPYLTAKPEIEDSPMPQAAPFRLTRLYGQVNHLVIKW